MKKLLLIFLLLIIKNAHAQNWQCLQPGVRHYFTNGNGYLRGMRIDSMTTSGGNTTWYPFRMLRGAYDSSFGGLSSLSSDGGSWLGKMVTGHSDGTTVFDSYWGPDSVVIKTKANTGDSWTMYSDTTSLYYTATVTSIDTMTLQTGLDSVKKMLINARTSSGVVTTDPVNGFTLLLSKNNGFVRVCDLYTFPYHKPDSAYRAGLDFMLDHSTCTYDNVQAPYGHVPDTIVSLFTMTNFVVPNDTQLCAHRVGDVIESIHTYGLSPLSVEGNDYLFDTVSSATASGTATSVVFIGTNYVCSHGEPCSLIAKPGSYTLDATHHPITDTVNMTETFALGAYVFYNPSDGSYGVAGPLYTIAPLIYSPARSLDFEYDYTRYKVGVGKTAYYHFDDEAIYEQDALVYLDIAGTRWGTPLDTIPALTKNIQASEAVVLSPNPAFSTLNISATEPMSELEVLNMIGELVYEDKPMGNRTGIDIAAWPAGIYIVRINEQVVRKFVKE